VVSDIFRQDSRSVPLLSHSHYSVGKIVDQISDVLWSKLSSKHLTVPDHERFRTQLLSFKIDGIFLMLSAA
jgi:uncharacterized membrane protein